MAAGGDACAAACRRQRRIADSRVDSAKTHMGYHRASPNAPLLVGLEEAELLRGVADQHVFRLLVVRRARPVRPAETTVIGLLLGIPGAPGASPPSSRQDDGLAGRVRVEDLSRSNCWYQSERTIVDPICSRVFGLTRCDEQG